MDKRNLKRTVSALVLGCALSLTGTAVLAGVAVIVNPGSGVTSMSDSDIKKLFLGKSKKLPNGKHAAPVNQDEDSATYEAFGDKVLGKSASQLKAYWSKLIFSGKGTPPKSVGDDAAVKAHVAGNADAIGYIDSSQVDGSVTVVYTAD